MVADLVTATLGLAILLFAGDLLVRGAAVVALRLGIPPLIVGLTVVAIGTSVPNLLVAVAAVIEGLPGLALGSVVGANTANVLLVLGLPALGLTLKTSRIESTRSYLAMMAGTGLFIALAFTGSFAWPAGLALLAAMGVSLWLSWAETRAHRAAKRAAIAIAAEAAEAAGEAEPLRHDDDGAQVSGPRLAAYLGFGLAGLPIGAELLVRGAGRLAEGFGLGEAFVGLTLVAIGTSLPELSATLMAARRRQAGMALGNVIGSNAFNLLACVGVASLFGPIPVAPEFLRLDLWVMLGASALLAPIVLMRRDIGPATGALFVGLYAIYLVALTL